ncbi:MAG: tetratricopeptide repeat protein [Chitinophagales bacterium]|nr:tetratricopeptide repeat protein [Chitinophagales bacterium]MDW8393842.1 tetratricopeptide repeat protein [Chitinophagales bacterium]
MNFRPFCFWFILFFLALGFAPSRAQKKTDSWIVNTYQNTNARYNGYYYAKMKMTEAEKQVLDNRKEDYEKLLPLYLTGNPDDAFSATDMDSIIRRLTLVIKLRDSKKWNDDAYFNIGKAYYYKKDYSSALAAFQYVSAKIGKGSLPKKDKEAEKKSEKKVNPFTGTVKESGSKPKLMDKIRHQPVYYTNLLWLVRTHAMLGNYGEAQSIIAYLDEDRLFPEDLRDDLRLVHAFVYVQQQRYPNAIDQLKKVIDLTRSKREATRYTFILAQLYQLQGDHGTAAQYFRQVSEMKPSPEMDFHARIAVVKSFLASGSGSPSQTIAALEDMAQDPDFFTFRDQIYYYIGLVRQMQGQTDLATESFLQSVKFSVNNSHQKGLSFLQLGSMALREKDYVAASAYYDSAVAYLTPKLDTLARVKELKTVLSQIVVHLKTIHQEDSLQRLASLSPQELDKFLAREASRQRKEQSKQEESTAPTFPADPFQQQTTASAGNWYFYNNSLKSSGYNEFLAKWGNRRNEDNWRRSTTASADDQATSDDQAAEAAKKDESGNDALVSAMREALPLTEEKRAASKQRIFDAYMGLGFTLYTGLNDLHGAIAAYEKAAALLPGPSGGDRCLYSLYLVHEHAGNSVRAAYYRQQVLELYPNSEFAGILSDPQFLQRQQQQTLEVGQLYASAYQTFMAGDYRSVLQQIRRADSLYHSNPIKPKFDLLRAMAIGGVSDRNTYIAALDSVTRKYPTGEERDKAIEILKLLGANTSVTNPRPPDPAQAQQKSRRGPSPYTFKPKEVHFAVVAFKTVDPRIKTVSDSLQRFNSRLGLTPALKVTTQLLDKNAQLIVVKQFANASSAIDYYDELTDSESLFDLAETIGYRLFLIDEKNFTTLYQRKDIDEYVDFFERLYENYDPDEEEESEGD